MKKLKGFFSNLSYIWKITAVVIVLHSMYWAGYASDRYVSSANVVLESPEIIPDSFNMAAMLSSSNATADLLLLRDHLLSVDMLHKLNNELDLRAHYSTTEADIFSRMWDSEVPMEKFHQYYLSRVKAEVDEYAGVLRINAEAFNPEMAQKIASLLLAYGEDHMNKMGQKLASEQVLFIEKQVKDLSKRLSESRERLIAYQNEHGLISPTGVVESISAVIAGLENELAQTEAKRNALRNFQSKTSPEVIKLTAQISALERQIKSERSRMATSSGNALNKLSSEYEELALQSQFALDLYSNALAALENTRVDAVRKLKQVSVLQNPTFPEYPVKPERAYNIFSFILLVFLVGLIMQMLVLIIKDHKD